MTRSTPSGPTRMSRSLRLSAITVRPSAARNAHRGQKRSSGAAAAEVPERAGVPVRLHDPVVVRVGDEIAAAPDPLRRAGEREGPAGDRAGSMRADDLEIAVELEHTEVVGVGDHDSAAGQRPGAPGHAQLGRPGDDAVAAWPFPGHRPVGRDLHHAVVSRVAHEHGPVLVHLEHGRIGKAARAAARRAGDPELTDHVSAGRDGDDAMQARIGDVVGAVWPGRRRAGLRQDRVARRPAPEDVAFPVEEVEASRLPGADQECVVVEAVDRDGIPRRRPGEDALHRAAGVEHGQAPESLRENVEAALAVGVEREGALKVLAARLVQRGRRISRGRDPLDHPPVLVSPEDEEARAERLDDVGAQGGRRGNGRERGIGDAHLVEDVNRVARGGGGHGPTASRRGPGAPTRRPRGRARC